MKKIKYLFNLLLMGTMLFALAACSQQFQQQSNAPSQSQETQMSGNNTETQNPENSQSATNESITGSDGSKVLVVYYSATGSTKAVAGYIANALGADTFELTPAKPYTSDDLDWRNENSRVSREYADPSLRTVELTSTTVEGWDSYDTVFIGYPIWWGIAAWPVDSFVRANDFTGKTVIPFCTSASSGLGESGKLLAELAGTGDWRDGQRFRSSVNETDVVEWVNGLDLAK